MKKSYICIITVFYIGFLTAAAVDGTSGPVYDYCSLEALLDRLGLSSATIIGDDRDKTGGQKLLPMLLESFVNIDRILQKPVDQSARQDFLTCMLARAVNAKILERNHGPVYSTPMSYMGLTQKKINLFYYNDALITPAFLGQVHKELPDQTEFYEWLMKFRDAQEQDASLCDRARLYAVMRQRFIAADDAWRAEKMRQFRAEAANPALSIFERATYKSRIDQGERCIIGFVSFKDHITRLEAERREALRKEAQLVEIGEAFRELLEN